MKSNAKLEGIAEELAKLIGEDNKKNNADTGACIVQSPADSTKFYCLKVTPSQCSRLSGTWVGGDCPS